MRKIIKRGKIVGKKVEANESKIRWENGDKVSNVFQKRVRSVAPSSFNVKIYLTFKDCIEDAPKKWNVPRVFGEFFFSLCFFHCGGERGL